MENQIAEPIHIRKVENVAFDHRLVQEQYQLTSPGLFPNHVANSFKVIDGLDGRGEILVKQMVDGKPNLANVARDSASNTGWSFQHNTEARMSWPDTTHLEGFYLGKELYVLGIWPPSLLVATRRDESGNWHTPQTIKLFNQLLGYALAKNIKTGYDKNGRPFFSGFFNNNTRDPWVFAIVYRNPENTAWLCSKVHLPDGFSEPNVVNLEIQDNQGFCILVGFKENKICEYTGQISFEGRISIIRRNERTCRTGTLHYLDVHKTAGKLDFLVHRDTVEELWYFWSPDPKEEYKYEILTSLPNGPKRVKKVATTELNGKCVALVLDDNHSLWKIEEKDRNGGAIQWGKWIPLNEHFLNISMAAQQSGELEFFGVSMDNKFQLQHMYQSQDSTWYLETVDNPASTNSTTVDAAAYVTEISCTDKDGFPAEKRLVEISATRYTEIIVGKTSFHVDARHKAKILTDESGKVRFSTKADTLMAPTFKVHIPDRMGDKAVAVRPDVHTFQKLAKASGEDLKKAGLVDREHEDRAGEIAKALNASADMVLKNPDKGEPDDLGSVPEWKRKTPYLHGLEIFDHADHDQFQVKPDFHHAGESWRLDFSAKSGATFRQLSAEDAMEFAGATDVLSVWESVGNFFQWVKRKVNDVITFAAEKLANGFNLLIDIGEGLVKFFVETVHQVANFIELMLRKIAEFAHKAVTAAIEWLKELLGWDHIFNTKDVLKHLVNKTFDNIQNSGTHFTNLIEKHFGQAVEKVKGDFDDVIDKLRKLGGGESGGGPSFADLAGQIKQPTDPRIGGFIEPDNATRTVNTHQVRANALSSTFKANGDAIGETLMAAMYDEEGANELQKLLQELAGIVKEFEQPMKTFIAAMQRIYQEPKNFLKLSIIGLLELIRDLLIAVMGATKRMATLVIGLLGRILGLFRDLLNKPIEIPVLSQLYRSANDGKDPTLLDLICLVIAAPITIMYRAFAFGGLDADGKPRPPFTKAQVHGGGGRKGVVNMKMPWPSFLLPEEQRTEDMDPDFREWLKLPWGILAGLNTFAGMVLNTALDVKGKINDQWPFEVKPDPVAVTFSFFSFFQSMAGFVLGAPYTKYAKGGAWATVYGIKQALDLGPIVLDGILLGQITRGRARQDGFAGVWTDSTMGLIRAGVGTVPAIILEIAENGLKADLLSILEALLGSVRGISGFLINKLDVKWIAFAVGQGISLLGEAGQGGLQIYNGIKAINELKAEELAETV